MNSNGHNKSVRDRLITTLQLNGGRLSMRDLIVDYSFKRSQIDAEFEKAACPFSIQIRDDNGNAKPATMVVLKVYTPPEPKTQADIAVKLNAMSPGDYRSWLERMDATYRLRHQRRSGGGARTSTSSDEYFGT